MMELGREIWGPLVSDVVLSGISLECLAKQLRDQEMCTDQLYKSRNIKPKYNFFFGREKLPA